MRAQSLDIASYWKETRRFIDNGVAKKVVSHVAEDEEFPGRYLGALKQGIEGGKRLRGMLLCLVCESLGGRKEDALDRAIAIECIHASTLIHDDIVDGDRFRRGKPAIWTLDGVGREGAILLGDFLWAFGMQMVSKMDREDIVTVANAMVRVTTGVIREFAGGGLLQGDMQDFYDRLIRSKTGELFGAATKLGALAAYPYYQSPALLDEAYSYGIFCGKAFQAADDLVDAEFSGVEMPETNENVMAALNGDVECAVESLREFPDSTYTKLLAQAPRFMVEAMLKKHSSLEGC